MSDLYRINEDAWTVESRDWTRWMKEQEVLVPVTINYEAACKKATSVGLRPWPFDMEDIWAIVDAALESNGLTSSPVRSVSGEVPGTESTNGDRP